MADISLEAVTGKLNRVGYEAFIQALRQAKGAGNRNVELAHWLFQILQGRATDLSLTADHYKLDRGRLLTDLGAVVEGFRKNETEMPGIANSVVDALDRGWHYATLFFGETQIRTGHVLVAALKSLELRRARRRKPRPHRRRRARMRRRARRSLPPPSRPPTRAKPAPRSMRNSRRWARSIRPTG